MAKKKNKSKRNSKDLQMDKKLQEKFVSEYGERFGNEKITKVNIADADLEYSQLFGANKNLYRTIASMSDGLKPGARRLLYSWWELEHKPTNTKKETLNKLKFIKVDKLSANTVNYHPHGTSATDELIGKLGQYWSNNVMLIVPQGSYGNQRGDMPAAGRYREAKMSEFTIDCFFDDFDKYCVPMKLGYDGENYEPVSLPAKYPYILFNPQFSGIGWGMSSNIPSFNVSEVLDATIELIRNPKANIMLIPDSPTGCDIIDEGNFVEINELGQSKVTFRATSNIDFVSNSIWITSLPINSASKDVISKIIAFRSKGLFEDIAEIQDSTKEGEVSIRIRLKPDAKPEKVLKQLYKRNTGLKSTFPVGITVIDDYSDYEYGVKDLLLQWIDYRVDIVRSMFLNNLQMTLSKIHMNEVLLMVFNKDNIDTTIHIAKSSKTRAEAIERFMKKFGITSLQAGVIADMRVYQFTSETYARFKQESIDLQKEYENINEILQDENKLEEFIIKQLEEGKKKWGRPRKSKVVKEDDGNDEDIPDTEHLIGISETGFIKKISLKANTSIGAVGKTNSNMYVFQINNRENLLVIDSLGNVIKISVSAIPDMEFEDIGVELKKFFSVQGDIKAVMELPSMKILDVKNESLGIIFITKNGMAKRTALSEFKKLTDYKSGITLNKGDEVAAAMFSVDNSMKDIIISTDKGNGIRLPIAEIRNSGAQAKGVSMVTLKDDEVVVNASMVNPKRKYLFYITSSGRAKITEMEYFPVMERKGETMNLISLQGGETLVGVHAVDKNDVVMVYRKKDEPEKIEIKSMTPGTRVSKGDKLIKTGRGDCVVAFKVFKA